MDEPWRTDDTDERAKLVAVVKSNGKGQAISKGQAAAWRARRKEDLAEGITAGKNRETSLPCFGMDTFKEKDKIELATTPSAVKRLQQRPINVLPLWKTDPISVLGKEQKTDEDLRRKLEGGVGPFLVEHSKNLFTTANDIYRPVGELQLKERLFLFYQRQRKDMIPECEAVANYWKGSEDGLNKILATRYGGSNLESEGLGRHATQTIDMTRLLADMAKYRIEMSEGYAPVDHWVPQHVLRQSTIALRDSLLLSEVQLGRPLTSHDVSVVESFAAAEQRAHRTFPPPAVAKNVEEVEEKQGMVDMWRVSLSLKEQVVGLSRPQTEISETPPHTPSGGGIPPLDFRPATADWLSSRTTPQHSTPESRATTPFNAGQKDVGGRGMAPMKVHHLPPPIMPAGVRPGTEAAVEEGVGGALGAGGTASRVEWKMRVSQTHNEVFWYSTVTGESRWTRPQARREEEQEGGGEEEEEEEDWQLDDEELSATSSVASSATGSFRTGSAAGSFRTGSAAGSFRTGSGGMKAGSFKKAVSRLASLGSFKMLRESSTTQAEPAVEEAVEEGGVEDPIDAWSHLSFDPLKYHGEYHSKHRSMMAEHKGTVPSSVFLRLFRQKGVPLADARRVIDYMTGGKDGKGVTWHGLAVAMAVLEAFQETKYVPMELPKALSNVPAMPAGFVPPQGMVVDRKRGFAATKHWAAGHDGRGNKRQQAREPLTLYEFAVVKVQSVGRGFLVRLFMSREKALLERIVRSVRAAQIQNWWKKYLASLRPKTTELSKKQNVAFNPLQNRVLFRVRVLCRGWLRRARFRMRAQLRSAAALVIQRKYRAVVWMRKLRRMRFTMLEEACVVVQRAWRKRLEWIKMVREEEARVAREAKRLANAYLFGGLSQKEAAAQRQKSVEEFAGNTSELGRSRRRQSITASAQGDTPEAPRPQNGQNAQVSWLVTLKQLLRADGEEEGEKEEGKEEGKPPEARARTNIKGLFAFTGVKNPDDVEAIISEQRGGAAKVLNICGKGLLRWPYGITDRNTGRPLWLWLQTVWLSNNDLAGLPLDFYMLTSLTDLRLDKNRISGFPPQLGGLSKLQMLWLHENNIRSLPSEMGNLNQVTHCTLHTNKLASLPFEMYRMSSLKQLALENNPILSPPPSLAALGLKPHGSDLIRNYLAKFFESLSEPHRLVLEEFKLQTIPPDISRIKGCTELIVRKNNLVTLDPEVLWDSRYKMQMHPALTKLDVSSNKITELPDILTKLISLITINLENNLITMLPMNMVVLSNLTDLRAKDNPLSFPPMEVVEHGVEVYQILGSRHHGDRLGFFFKTTEKCCGKAVYRRREQDDARHAVADYSGTPSVVVTRRNSTQGSRKDSIPSDVHKQRKSRSRRGSLGKISVSGSRSPSRRGSLGEISVSGSRSPSRCGSVSDVGQGRLSRGGSFKEAHNLSRLGSMDGETSSKSPSRSGSFVGAPKTTLSRQGSSIESEASLSRRGSFGGAPKTTLSRQGSISEAMIPSKSGSFKLAKAKKGVARLGSVDSATSVRSASRPATASSRPHSAVAASGSQMSSRPSTAPAKGRKTIKRRASVSKTEGVDSALLAAKIGEIGSPPAKKRHLLYYSTQIKPHSWLVGPDTDPEHCWLRCLDTAPVPSMITSEWIEVRSDGQPVRGDQVNLIGVGVFEFCWRGLRYEAIKKDLKQKKKDLKASEDILRRTGDVQKLVAVQKANKKAFDELSGELQVKFQDMALRSLPKECVDMAAKIMCLQNNLLRRFPAQLCAMNRLMRLDLSDNLVTSITENFRKLTSLTTLNLMKNDIVNLPYSVSELTSLTILNISHNKLNLAPPIEALTKLVEIDFDHNRITCLPLGYSELVRLSSLKLGMNNIETMDGESVKIGGSEFGAMQGWGGMKELDLHGNFLSDLSASAKVMEHITFLDISRNNFHDLSSIEKSMHHWHCLTKLDANECSLESVPACIKVLKCLADLILSSNNFSEFPTAVSHLPVLQRLKLNVNFIKILPANIGSMTAITELDLKNNELIVVAPEIRFLTNLTTLNLGHNHLRALPPFNGMCQEVFGKLAHKLENLDVSSNFLKALPFDMARFQRLKTFEIADNPFKSPLLLNALRPCLGSLGLRVIEGSEMPRVNLQGQAGEKGSKHECNPFVRSSIYHKRENGRTEIEEVKRTSTKHETLGPIWNESLVFKIFSTKDSLSVEIVHGLPLLATDEQKAVGEQTLGKIDIPVMATILMQDTFWSCLGLETLKKLAEFARSLTFKKDEVIVTQGDKDGNYYFVMLGEVTLCTTDSSGIHKPFGKLEPLQGIGGCSFLTNSPQKQTLIAATDTKVFVLRSDAEERVLHPGEDEEDDDSHLTRVRSDGISAAVCGNSAGLVQQLLFIEYEKIGPDDEGMHAPWGSVLWSKARIDEFKALRKLLKEVQVTHLMTDAEFGQGDSALETVNRTQRDLGVSLLANVVQNAIHTATLVFEKEELKSKTGNHYPIVRVSFNIKPNDTVDSILSAIAMSAVSGDRVISQRAYDPSEVLRASISKHVTPPGIDFEVEIDPVRYDKEIERMTQFDKDILEYRTKGRVKRLWEAMPRILASLPAHERPWDTVFRARDDYTSGEFWGMAALSEYLQSQAGAADISMKTRTANSRTILGEVTDEVEQSKPKHEWEEINKSKKELQEQQIKRWEWYVGLVLLKATFLNERESRNDTLTWQDRQLKVLSDIQQELYHKDRMRVIKKEIAEIEAEMVGCKRFVKKAVEDLRAGWKLELVVSYKKNKERINELRPKLAVLLTSKMQQKTFYKLGMSLSKSMEWKKPKELSRLFDIFNEQKDEILDPLHAVANILGGDIEPDLLQCIKMIDKITPGTGMTPVLVCEWMSADPVIKAVPERLTDMIKVVMKHEVDGRTLFNCGMADLQRMGLPGPSARLLMSRAHHLMKETGSVSKKTMTPVEEMSATYASILDKAEAEQFLVENVLLGPDLIAELAAIFNGYDVHGTGEIPAKFMEKILAERGDHPHKSELRRMYEIADREDSGSTDFVGFCMAMKGTSLVTGGSKYD